MKKTTFLHAAAFLLSFIILSGCTKTDITAPPTQEQSDDSQIEKIREGDATLSTINADKKTIITGGGKFFAFGEEKQFALHAIQNKDGSVKGKLVYHSEFFDANIDIDCINAGSFVNGKFARLTGIITKIKVQERLKDLYREGDRIEFNVRDRGEGNTSLPDQVSDTWILGPEINCNTFGPFAIATYPVTSGNIQIKLASE